MPNRGTVALVESRLGLHNTALHAKLIIGPIVYNSRPTEATVLTWGNNGRSPVITSTKSTQDFRPTSGI